MTRARSTRASWSAAAVVSPVVAALAAGSILWAASNNPLATAADVPAAPAATSVPAAAVDSRVGAEGAQLSLDELRRKAQRLERAVKKARKEARAAGVTSVDSGGSTWVPSATSGSSGGNSGANAQPAPQPAPAPASDTWTGSSGG